MRQLVEIYHQTERTLRVEQAYERECVQLYALARQQCKAAIDPAWRDLCEVNAQGYGDDYRAAQASTRDARARYEVACALALAKWEELND